MYITSSCSLTLWHTGWSPWCVTWPQRGLFSCPTTRAGNDFTLVSEMCLFMGAPNTYVGWLGPTYWSPSPVLLPPTFFPSFFDLPFSPLSLLFPSPSSLSPPTLSHPFAIPCPPSFLPTFLPPLSFSFSPFLHSCPLLLFSIELYENLGQVGASIKQHLVDGMRNMWHQLNEIARSHTSQPTDKDQPDTPQGKSFHRR